MPCDRCVSKQSGKYHCRPLQHTHRWDILRLFPQCYIKTADTLNVRRSILLFFYRSTTSIQWAWRKSNALYTNVQFIARRMCLQCAQSFHARNEWRANSLSFPEAPVGIEPTNSRFAVADQFAGAPIVTPYQGTTYIIIAGPNDDSVPRALPARVPL